RRLLGSSAKKYAPKWGAALYRGVFFHCVGNIAQFPRKSKRYGRVKRYFRHAWWRDSQEMVNSATNSASNDLAVPQQTAIYRRIQSPSPVLEEKCSVNLLGTVSHCFASSGGGFLAVMFGQIFANSALSETNFSKPGSVSGLMASTGHSGSQTPQSIHSSGRMTSIFSPS